MLIAGEGKITAFGEKHKKAAKPLSDWLEIVEQAEWKHSVDMKKHFKSANILGSQTIFNIGGNKYRLIALISYKIKRVWVQYVLTHEEYDKGAWKAK